MALWSASPVVYAPFWYLAPIPSELFAAHLRNKISPQVAMEVMNPYLKTDFYIEIEKNVCFIPMQNKEGVVILMASYQAASSRLT